MASEQSVMAVIRAARPNFRGNQDKVAFVVHASFLVSGYVLNAVGPRAFADDALSSSSTEEVGIDQWNEVEGEYAFLYVIPEKPSEKALVKCLGMSDKLLVSVLATGSKEPLYLEINIGKYASESGGTNYSAQFKNLDKLVKNIQDQILFKLNDDSRLSLTPSTSIELSSVSRPNRLEGDDRDVGVSEDTNPQLHPSGVIVPPVYPVGGGDLYPGPGAGFYPSRGGFGDGSMLLGPNDPRWGGIGRQPHFPEPSPGVPPGARFDPFGPPDVPGFEPGRFIRNPRRPGGETHPDLEHFGGGSDFI